MIAEIHGSVDIVVQLFHQEDDDDDDDEEITCIDQNEIQLKENEKKLPIVRIPEYQLNARPLYSIQQRYIPFIRQQFKEQHRLLLNTHKSNTMYSCTIDEWETNISAFVILTNAYHLIEELNDNNENCIKKYLDDLVSQMNKILDHLLEQQWIDSNQYEEMNMKHSNVQLDHLFFVPDTQWVRIIHHHLLLLF